MKPGVDELELSLFGPGYGECVVLHLGNGRWLVVDSCLHADRQTPAALAYFAAIGVDPATEIEMVVVSHWHDDHIRGAGALIEAARSAKVVFSAALHSREFLQVTQLQVPAGGLGSGVDEMQRVLRALRATARQPEWAVNDKRLLATPAEVWSLSPGNQQFTQALAAWRAALDPTAPSGRRVREVDQNEGAIALHVDAGGRRLLLGSDLEEDGLRGWSAVLASGARPKERCEVYKVAHHGSLTAEHSGIWETLVEAAPLCVITPFLRGVHPLPDAADVARLCAAKGTGRLYQTAAAKFAATPRTGAKDRAVRGAVRWIHQTLPPFGHIRLRTSLSTPTDAWRVALDGAAFQVCGSLIGQPLPTVGASAAPTEIPTSGGDAA